MASLFDFERSENLVQQSQENEASPINFYKRVNVNTDKEQSINEE